MQETLHIYTRVSTAAQEDGASLDTQKDIGITKSKELGMTHKVWNEGSASSHHEDLLNRPVLSQLLGEIESGSIKHLFVFNNDRLSRNDITQQTILKDPICLSCGVFFVLTHKGKNKGVRHHHQPHLNLRCNGIFT